MTIIYAKKPQRIRHAWWLFRYRLNRHWRAVVWLLVVAFAILVTAYVTSKHPT